MYTRNCEGAIFQHQVYNSDEYSDINVPAVTE